MQDDPNFPCKPPDAYLIWLNEHKEHLTKMGKSVDEFTEKAVHMWKLVTDKSVSLNENMISMILDCQSSVTSSVYALRPRLPWPRGQTERSSPSSVTHSTLE